MSSSIYDPHRIRQKANRYYQRKGQIIRCKDVKYKTVCATMEDAEKYKQAVRIYFPEKYYSSIFMTKTSELNPEELKDGDLIYFSFPWSSMKPYNDSYVFEKNGIYLICSDYGLTLPDTINYTFNHPYYIFETIDDLLIFQDNKFVQTNHTGKLPFYTKVKGKWEVVGLTPNENFKFAYYLCDKNTDLQKVSDEHIIYFTSEPQKYPD